MGINNTLWHDSREHPKNKAYILIVHDYYNFGRDETEVVLFYPSYTEGCLVRDNVFVPKGGWGVRKWFDWAWKIKKWCYIDDVLKIE